jgi:hypothetical protein
VTAVTPLYQGFTAVPTVTAEDRRLLGRDVAARLAASTGADAAFLAGSTAVGLGSGTSDIDVHLVGAGLPAARRQMVVRGVRVDVQSVAAQTLTDLVDRIVGVERPEPARASVSDRDVALAVRLCTGEVVTDTGVLATLRARIAADPLALRRLVISGWAQSTYTAAEDLSGLWRSDDDLDFDMAMLTARQALIAAGKALVAGCGDLYHGEKWVWRQIARSAPAAFPLAEFRRLLREDELAGNPAAGLAARVSFAQTCLVAAMTLGWHGVHLDHWPGWLDEGGPLRRAAFFLPQRYADGMSIVGPGTRVFPVPADVVLVWGLCNGSSAGGIATRAAALRTTATPFARLTERRCHTVLRKLIEAALVIDMDGSGAQR